MDKKYLYLVINLASVIVPLIFSFHPRIRFDKQWKYFIPAIFLTAIIFLTWDEAFTHMKVWGFNAEYVTGIYIGMLPLEEVLFFICIPYACLFTYHSINTLARPNVTKRIQDSVLFGLVTTCLLLGLLNLGRWYTASTFLFLATFLMADHYYLRPKNRGNFYLIYCVLLLPFFIVNGILTGSFIERPVVWYNNSENLGIRLGTIPVEDVFYGMLMILMSVVFAELLEKREKVHRRGIVP